MFHSASVTIIIIRCTIRTSYHLALVLHSHFAVPKQACNQLSKRTPLFCACGQLVVVAMPLVQGTKVCRRGEAVWAMCPPALGRCVPSTHMYTIIMTVSVPRVGRMAKLKLKLALSQNLVPSRFREELNVMANNQVLHSHFAVPKQACNQLSKPTPLFCACGQLVVVAMPLVQGTKVCRHGEAVWAMCPPALGRCVPSTHMYTFIMTVSVQPHFTCAPACGRRSRNAMRWTVGKNH